MYNDISHLYGEQPGTIFDNYRHSELDLMMQRRDWKALYSILTTDERETIRNYRSHVRGECGLYAGWIQGIEKAIAHINEHCWQQLNQRLAIYDRIEKRYWSSITPPYWCKTKRRCLIFLLEQRAWLQAICDRSNKSVGERRFLVVSIDATKRLKLQKPF